MSLGPLQKEELAGLKLPGVPQKICYHEGMYLFYCIDNSLHTYNVDKKLSIKLPPPTISCRVTTIALSPAHTIASICFEDGSMQLFDLCANKASKAMNRYRKVCITYSCFINDSLLVLFDKSNTITRNKISTGMFGISAKEISSKYFTTFAQQLLIPSVTKPPSIIKPGAVARCISPQFESILGISFYNKFILASTIPDFKIIAEYPINNPIGSFHLANTDCLMLAIANETTLNIYSISGSKKPELVKTYSHQMKPKLVSFLSNSIVAITSEENNVMVFTSEEPAEAKLDTEGFILSVESCINVITHNSIIYYSMSSFEDRIRQMNSFEEIISLCQKALQDDPDSSIGLPPTLITKSIVIENAITEKFNERIFQMLEQQNPSEVAQYAINLSKELFLKNWVVNHGLRIFNEKEQALILIRIILQTDPDATFFFYTQEFVEMLISNSQNIDINQFLVKLPSKITPPKILLPYAYERHDHEMIANIYLNRLHDPKGACLIMLSENNFDKVIQIIKDNPSQSLFKWLFSFDQGKFPYLQQLMNHSAEQTIEIFGLVFNDNPFSDEILMNAIISTLSSMQATISNPVHIFVENKLLEQNIHLNAASLHYILPKIFSNEFNEPDQREPLLLSLIDSNLPEKLVISFIPLCDIFNFITAKRMIQVKLKMFSSILQDILDKNSENPFAWIKNIFRQDAPPDSIKDVFIINSEILIFKDVKEYASLALSHFATSIDAIIESIKNAEYRNIFIYQILKNGKDKKLGKYLNSAIPFVCDHFPNDLIMFIKAFDFEYDSELVSICEKQGLIDCCAYISLKSENPEKINEYLQQLICYELIDKIDIICEIIKLNKSATNIEMLVDGFYEVIVKTDLEGVDKLSEAMKKVALSCTDFYEFLETTCKRFSILDKEKYVKFIKLFFTNSSFTAPQAMRLKSLLNNVILDESLIDELKCANCTLKLFIPESGIRILPCGHALHNNNFCIRCNLCLNNDKMSI